MREWLTDKECRHMVYFRKRWIDPKTFAVTTINICLLCGKEGITPPNVTTIKTEVL